MYDVPATPDGRRANDRVSYGVGPGIHGRDITLTSVLSAAAEVAHDRCACGNPLLLSLNRADARGPEGRRRLRQVIETYFGLGGFHLHFNLLDAAALRAAQASPDYMPPLRCASAATVRASRRSRSVGRTP